MLAPLQYTNRLAFSMQKCSKDRKIDSVTCASSNGDCANSCTSMEIMAGGWTGSAVAFFGSGRAGHRLGALRRRPPLLARQAFADLPAQSLRTRKGVATRQTPVTTMNGAREKARFRALSSLRNKWNELTTSARPGRTPCASGQPPLPDPEDRSPATARMRVLGWWRRQP